MARPLAMIMLVTAGLLSGCPTGSGEHQRTQAQQFQVVFYAPSNTLVASLAFPKALAGRPELSMATEGILVDPDQFETDEPVHMLLRVQGSSTHTPGQHFVITATPCTSITPSVTDAGTTLRCEGPLDDTRPTEVTVRDHTLPVPVSMAYGMTAAVSDG